MKNKNLYGLIILLITSIIWGAAFVFQRTGMDHIEPITFNAVRMSAAAIFLIVLSFILDKFKKTEYKPSEIERKETIKTTIKGGLFCGFFLAASSIVQQAGMVHTTAGKAGFITAMYMLFVPIINLIIFKKKGNAKLWISVLLGILGMYLLCIKEDLSFTQGDLLILGCAVLFSGHILCCDKYAPKCDAVKLSAIQFTTATIISSILAFILEEPSVEKVISAAVPILYCGIVSGGIGYTLQIIGQKHTDPTAASLIMSLESVFAALAGVVLLNERMTTQELIGSVIMFAAIILVQLPSKNKTNKQNSI